MGVIKNWLGIPYTLQLFIVKLVGSLAWLSCVALAHMDISETVTSSVSFPDVGITCLTNLAIFITSLLRGRLDLEVAVRDVLAIKRGTKLEHIHRFGLTTCKNHVYERASVVLLSYQSPNSSIRQFMRYISSAHDVQSILLECLPLRSAALLAEICNCNGTVCKCIVFCTVEEVTFLLAKRLPKGTLKRLSGNLCLLLSRHCLINDCHGCNQSLLYVDEQERLREDGKKIEGEAMERSSVLETLDYIYEKSVPEKRTCVCIPLHPARKDLWTDHLMRSFRSKDKESRGVRVMASDALKNYMALGSQANYMASEIVEAKGVEVRYSSGSLIVPRFIELFLNISLTGWFRTDGFSTAIVARRAVRNYLTDSKGTGFGANSFVTKARVKSSKVQLDNKVQPDNDDLVDVCQVLTFRGSFVSLRTLSFIGCFVNLGCSFCWALVVAFEGSDGRKWHYTHSMRPSIARVAVIMAALVICLGMDCLHLYLATFPRPIPFKKSSEQNSLISIKTCETSCKGSKFPNRVLIVWAVIVLEILCIVACSTLLGVWGIKHFGRWIYSAMHLLVWVKWGIGSYLLGEHLPKHASGPVTATVCGKKHAKWTDNGILVYSSAFLLNAILAGVRGKWDYLPSGKND